MTALLKFADAQGKRIVAAMMVGVLYVTLISFGTFLVGQTAYAASVTSFKDTLSNSALASASNHTIQFTVTTAIAGGGSFSLDFETDFTFGSVDFTDVDIASSGGDYTLAASASVNTLGVTFNETAQRMLVKLGSGNNVGAAETLTIEIGTNATAGATGDQQMTNPSAYEADSFFIDATTYSPAGATLDTGTTFVAAISQVTLNAVVAGSFTFVIDGMSTSESIDGQTVASASEDFYVGFGTLTASTPIMMGSSLSVTTNAANGFVVTVQQNHNLLASSGADIDCFDDGVCASTGAAWNSPAGTIGSEATYGHLGLHSEDGSNTIANVGSVSSTTNGDFFGLTTGTPIEVWDYSGAADGITQDIGHIDVGYRIEISALQEAGRYQNRVMYIATPTF